MADVRGGAGAVTGNQCRTIGHPLHQSNHNADLWIAATAIRWSIPLVAHDAVFTGTPGVQLLTELGGGG
jgi:predicted nucleic acid-binding protein